MGRNIQPLGCPGHAPVNFASCNSAGSQRPYFKTVKPHIRFTRQLGDFATAQMLPHRSVFLALCGLGFCDAAAEPFRKLRGADHKGEFGLE